MASRGQTCRDEIKIKDYFLFFIIHKAKMINENMYKENVMNQSNAFKLFLEIENP